MRCVVVCNLYVFGLANNNFSLIFEIDKNVGNFVDFGLILDRQ